MGSKISQRSAAAALVLLGDSRHAQGLHAAGAADDVGVHANPHAQVSQHVLRQDRKDVGRERLYRALVCGRTDLYDAVARPCLAACADGSADALTIARARTSRRGDHDSAVRAAVAGAGRHGGSVTDCLADRALATISLEKRKPRRCGAFVHSEFEYDYQPVIFNPMPAYGP